MSDPATVKLPPIHKFAEIFAEPTTANAASGVDVFTPTRLLIASTANTLVSNVTFAAPKATTFEDALEVDEKFTAELFPVTANTPKVPTLVMPV